MPNLAPALSLARSPLIEPPRPAPSRSAPHCRPAEQSVTAESPAGRLVCRQKTMYGTRARARARARVPWRACAHSREPRTRANRARVDVRSRLRLRARARLRLHLGAVDLGGEEEGELGAVDEEEQPHQDLSCPS